MRQSLYYFILLSMLGSCTALKYVPEEERLYTGAKVEVLTQKKVTDQGDAVSGAKSLLMPTPNHKLLWMRPSLWMYGVVGPLKKEKGFKHWLKTSVGEPPVYMSNVDPS